MVSAFDSSENSEIINKYSTWKKEILRIFEYDIRRDGFL